MQQPVHWLLLSDQTNYSDEQIYHLSTASIHVTDSNLLPAKACKLPISNSTFQQFFFFNVPHKILQDFMQRTVIK